jgi:hypothetical protein
MRGLELTILPRAAAEESAFDTAAKESAFDTAAKESAFDTAAEEELQQTSLSREGFARTATRIWRISTVQPAGSSLYLRSEPHRIAHSGPRLFGLSV